MNQSDTWTDWMGVTASVACAIHCAAMPFVVAFLPMLGLSFLADESFHQVMVFVCSALAIAAFIPGLRRHRRLLPIGVAAIGLSMISTAAFGLEGACCASCNPSVQAAETDSSAEVCSEACCTHCAVESADQETSDVSNVTGGSEASVVPGTNSFSLASALGPLTAWITPLGGLLLVSAHLTNRRFSCRCGCCPSGANENDASAEV